MKFSLMTSSRINDSKRSICTHRVSSARGAVGCLFAVTLITGFLTSSKAAQAQAAPGVILTPLTDISGNLLIIDQGLIKGFDGNLYGTSIVGGAGNSGEAFELTPADNISLLYDFSYGNYGSFPEGGLVLGSDGNFYGTTTEGPDVYKTSGTIFKLTPSGKLSTLYTFSENVSGGNADGAFPGTALVEGLDRNFYGLTEVGGANNSGVVFKIAPSGSFTVLHSFDSSVYYPDITTTTLPRANLALGSDGDLYGSTQQGGANGDGTLFKITSSGTYTLLYTFSGTDGSYPMATLALGRDGNLYGTTSAGGQYDGGTIFKINPSGALSTVYNFGDPSNAVDGADPQAGMTLASDANFYGTTVEGGQNGRGTLFEMTPGGFVSTLYSFGLIPNSPYTLTDGYYPNTTLVEGVDKALYGTTSDGSYGRGGVIFKVTTPNLANPPARFDFNQDGHADLIWYNTGSGALSVWDMNDSNVLAYGAAFAQLAPSSGWQPVAAPDVNGDGVPDLIWWNNQTGELSAWTLSAGNPPSVTSYGADFGTIPDTTWKPVAAADVTGTTWELVFQNSTTGNISTWQMNGTTVVSYGGTLGSVGAGSGWQCVGAPDLNGDGHSDLLFWNNQTGEVSWWGCNLGAQQVLSYNADFAQVNDTTWHLQGSEDTNGDGHPDLIWWNASSGEESRWLMSGTTVTQYGGVSTQVPDTTWQPTAIR